jgi:phosphatidylglycerophosphate synthase
MPVGVQTGTSARTMPSGARAALVAGPALQVALLIALTDTVRLGVAGWLVALGCCAVTTGALTRGLARRGARALGPANAVTLVRATFVGAVAALVADAFVGTADVFALVLIAGLALVLDTVDGRVARRTGSVSVLGARFDMEVDALLILVLSCYVARSVGTWVLAIGAARYAYVAAAALLPWLREPTPPRHWCKVVAAVQGIVLTVAAAAVLPVPVITAALVLALLLLAESFGRQVWWLYPNADLGTTDAAAPVDVRAPVLAPVG